MHAGFAVSEAMLRIEDSAGSMVKGCKGSPSMRVKLAEIQGNSAEITNSTASMVNEREGFSLMLVMRRGQALGRPRRCKTFLGITNRPNHTIYCVCRIWKLHESPSPLRH